VRRNFRAGRPDALWVADIASVRTCSAFCYLALVIEACSRRILGWQLAQHLRTDLALDALEMAVWTRSERLSGLVHHTDRGTQYLAIRYTERLGQLGAVASVGSRGDSSDNALAESVIGLVKTELIARRGPFRGLAELELAVLGDIDWFNHRRVHSALGHLPPAEYERRHRAAEAEGPGGPVEAGRPALIGGAPAGLETSLAT
jgi:putative transposase